MWWCSLLLDTVVAVIILLYECYILQRFTKMESEIDEKKEVANSSKNEDVEDDLDSLNKDNFETISNNNLENTISNSSLDITITLNNLGSTISDNNLENTIPNSSFDITSTLNNLGSTISDNNLENTTSNNNTESTTISVNNLDSTSIVYIESATLNRILTTDDTNIGGNGEKVVDIIKLPDLFKGKMPKMYEVNGTTFFDDNGLSSNNDDTVLNYKLYKCEKKEVVLEDEDGDDDMTTELDVHIQNLPQGVIINSNVFLWHAHWHTMTLVEGNVFCCAVCKIYCDRASLDHHIETAAHLRNINEFRPLKRFDLSVIRKISENFHCGVCNDIFDIIDYKIHESSKAHEGNLLTAINKVSDLMYDSNIHKNVSIERQFNNVNRNIQNYGLSYGNSNIENRDRDSQNRDRENQNRDRDMLNHDRDVESRNNNDEFHFDANAINNNNLQVYEEFWSSGEEEEEEEEEEEMEEEEEFEEYCTPFQGVSYASMASKPTINLPKFLKIDLGTKEVRVKLESWHMITKIELNKFYCMVCNKTDQIRFKSQHCISCEHVEKLAKCTVVKGFEDYLIRKVDDKLYHCGHCNNLQYQDQITDHIESAHPKKNKNIIDTAVLNSPLKTKKSTKNIDKNMPSHKVPEQKSIDIEKNIDCKNIPNKASEQKNVNSQKIDFKIEPRIDPNFDIFGDLIVSPFGTELKISALAFNFIKETEGGYYCAICDKICENVRVHVGDSEHVELMTMTPFIRPFKCNLTRAIRGTLHCSLCNVLLPVNEMYNHNIDSPHTNALAKALGMQKSQKPARQNFKPIQTYFENPIAPRPFLTQSVDQNVPKLSPLPHEPSKSPKPIMTNQSCDQKVPILSSVTVKPKIQNPAVNTEVKNTQTNNVLKISCQNDKIASTSLFSPNQEMNKPMDSFNSSKTAPKGAQFNFNSGVNFNYGSNFPNPAQNHSNLAQNHPIRAQNQSNLAQNHPNPTQNYPSPTQNYPNPTQNYPNPTQNHPNLAQNIPYPGQSHQNYPIQNAMLPIVHSQNLGHFMFGPEATYPFPANPAAILSPNTNNQNIPTNQTNTNAAKNQNNVSKMRKNNVTNSIDKENIKGNENDKLGENILLKSDNISKSGNVTIESVASQSDDDECKLLDEEEMVVIKFKTAYFKITNLSYNTLVYLDNGLRYCFVCSLTISSTALCKHVETREHAENVSKNKFLDKYGVQLFRQMYLMYHCAICNELMTRKEIKLHLDWSLHIESYDASHIILNKKKKKQLKSGIKEYVVKTQKEAIYHNVNEPKISLVAAYQIVRNMDAEKDDLNVTPTKRSKSCKATAIKKNKMIIMNNVVMKVSFDQWHGITTAKNATKCIICQVEIRQNKVFDHIETEYHGVALGKTFETTYYPALVRKINEKTVNCMICNLELQNEDYLIFEHISGRKHNKNQSSITNESSNSDSYTDCYEDYLNL